MWAAAYAELAEQVAVPAFAPPTRHRDYIDPFIVHYADLLAQYGDAPIPFAEPPWDDNARTAIGLDVESFHNFWCACLVRFDTGARLVFERSPRRDFDPAALEAVLRQGPIITFNGAAYDLPIVALALKGVSTEELKAASDRIIKQGIKPWQAERELGVHLPQCNHIDLMEPAPTFQSLKMIYGRLHGRFLVDLPYDPDAILTPAQMNVVTLYCFNDLEALTGLREALREALALRVAMGKEIGTDLRSKSDAQVGEAIVRRRVGRIERFEPQSMRFRYNVPDFISFAGAEMRGVVARLAEAEFFADAGGNVTPPDFLKNDLRIKIGNGEYRMGIGGLHSTEAHRALKADYNYTLVDIDVTGYYPICIHRLGLYPKAIGPVFRTIYKGMIDERTDAKFKGDKFKADGLKISNNSVFGKLGSPYSFLYAPDLLIATTLTGQLAVLMLIERAEAQNIRAVSSNTDGCTFHFDRSLEPEFDMIVANWEADTGFSVERTRYAALYNSSVNSYLAVKEGGGTKLKGPIADPWSSNDLRGMLSKNPQMTILTHAVERLAIEGVPLAQTMRACADPRQIITLIKVTGGALWRGHRLGRAVRYYWSTDGDPITYADGKRRVAKTDGARPLPELTDAMPPDVDWARYEAEAERLARDLAVIEPQRELGIWENE